MFFSERFYGILRLDWRDFDTSPNWTENNEKILTKINQLSTYLELIFLRI